jgi:hypothetical protein
MITETRVQVGVCGVDSGQIMLIDPCYVIDGSQYEAACKATLDTENGVGQMDGHESTRLGVCTSTGWGDGVYPVYATIQDCGNGPMGGKRVKSITIEFMEDENDE